MDDSSKCYQRWIKMLRELKAGFHGCVIGREWYKQYANLRFRLS